MKKVAATSTATTKVAVKKVAAKYAGTLTEVLNSDAPETTALGKTAFQPLKQDMPHNRLQQLWLCLNIYVGEDKAKAQETFHRDHWHVLKTKPEVTEMKEHPEAYQAFLKAPFLQFVEQVRDSLL